MMAVNKSWIALVLFLSISVLVQAQNDTWCVVMTQAGYAESYDKSSSFPATFINQQWQKGQYITELTYDGGQWWVVTAAKSYSRQAYYKSKSFPSSWVDKKWEEGFDITNVEFGGDIWVVVMTKGAGLRGESWGKRSSFEEIRTYIKQKWNDQKDIIDICYGNGEWVAVLANGADYNKQVYRWERTFPTKWTQEKYDLGYNITSLTYGEDKWVVVMSQFSQSKAEQYITSSSFPSSFIEKEWSKGKRISYMHYNYEKNLQSSFDEVFSQGVAAADKGEHDLAIYYYTEALKIKPNDALCYNNRAWSKYLDGQCSGALNDADRSVNLGATEFSYHTRGAIYLCLDRCHEAEKDFKRALQSAEKKDAFYYGDLGVALDCMGDYEDAIYHYKKALSLDPNSSQYTKLLANAESKVNKEIPPTVTWDHPYKNYTATTAPHYDIKACIHSKTNISSIQIFVNGQSFASRGFGVEDDCTETVNQKINLKPGRNKIEIVVKTPQQESHSEERIIEYKAQSSGNYHALLIAVENYDDFSINDLQKPIDDAESFRDVLTREYTFEPTDVHLLKNPTKGEILDKLVYLQDRLGEEDNLLVYYSGHGIVKNEVGYWLPSNSKKTSRVQWLSNAEVRDYMNGMKAKHTLVIADACFSGSIFSGGYRDLEEFACEEMAKLKSRRAMTSGANTVVPDNSVFFKYLIKKLKDNNTSCLSAETLYTKIKPAVIYNSPNNHVPQFGVLPQTGDEGGNFVFKRR